jgi:hypothetical protein
MNINNTQMNFFNAQVGGAASILGVSTDDVATIGTVLNTLFNQRCIPELTADSGVPSFMVGTNPSICQTPDCPVADASACPSSPGAPTQAPSSAQPAGTTLCSKYAVAVFMNNTADNQLALIQAVVNLAVLGDDTLPGILAPQSGLVDLFNGAGNTTNRGGRAVAVNFLDGAGGLPDNLDETSNTAFLLNHLYQFFGALLGCTASGFPAYEGVADMFEVHKFMNINNTQMNFFNAQVAGAASKLGVSEEDVGAIGTVLDTLFNQRCIPPLESDDGVPSFMVGTNPSICQTMDCPVADESACMDEDEQDPTSGATAQARAALASMVAVVVAPLIFFY